MSIPIIRAGRQYGPLLNVALFFMLVPGAVGQVSPSRQPSSPTRDRLEEEKLHQEILKIQRETEKLESPWETVLSFGTLVATAVGVGGLILTLWKQFTENNRQKELDRVQRDKDRQQREDELQSQRDQTFTTIITNLGSNSVSLQASAAVQIMGFLKPKFEDYHRQVFLILFANLKVQQNGGMQNETLAGLLINAFELAIRTKSGRAGENGDTPPLDLSRAYLNRADLHDLDLTLSDIAFADLRSANLTGSQLFRVRGYGVNLEKARLSRAKLGEVRWQTGRLTDAQFHESNLVAADLRKTDLTRAQFQQAKMQSAHLDNAVLVGARFENADLNDTYFYGAQLSPATLKSIVKAQNWRKAHFDPPITAELQKLAP